MSSNVMSAHNCTNSTVYYTRPPKECIEDELKLSNSNLITIIIYLIIFFLSSILNIVMLVIIYRHKKHIYTRVQLFMSHLLIADLIVTFITIPLEIGWKLSVMWLAGDSACRFFQFLRPLGIYLASFIIVSLSLDRYFSVKKNLIN